MFTGLCSGGDVWALELVPIFPLKLLFRRDSSSAYTADIWGKQKLSPAHRQVFSSPPGISAQPQTLPSWGLESRGEMCHHLPGALQGSEGEACLGTQWALPGPERGQQGRDTRMGGCSPRLCCKTQLPDSVGRHGGRTSLTICPRYSRSCPLGTGV